MKRNLLLILSAVSLLVLSGCYPNNTSTRANRARTYYYNDYYPYYGTDYYYNYNNDISYPATTNETIMNNNTVY